MAGNTVAQSTTLVEIFSGSKGSYPHPASAVSNSCLQCRHLPTMLVICCGMAPECTPTTPQQRKDKTVTLKNTCCGVAPSVFERTRWSLLTRCLCVNQLRRVELSFDLFCRQHIGCNRLEC